MELKKKLKSAFSRVCKFRIYHVHMYFERLKSFLWNLIHIKNVPSLSNYDKYVSLGFDCFPRSFLTLNKIKPCKTDGEKSMPLDLMFYHDLRATTNHILSDFKYFLKDVKFSKADNMFISNDNNLHFNHEGELDNSIEKIKIRYQNRAKNFSDTLKTEFNILFCLRRRANFSANDINLLYSALKYKKKKNFNLMVFDIDYETNLEVEKLKKEIILIRMPPKRKSFIWFKDKTTEEGLEFQKELLNKMRPYINTIS